MPEGTRKAKDQCAVDRWTTLSLASFEGRSITIANSAPASSIRAAAACFRESRFQPREDLLDFETHTDLIKRGKYKTDRVWPQDLFSLKVPRFDHTIPSA